MSKKHYAAMAELLRDYRKEFSNDMAFWTFVHAYADMCHRDNSAFSRNKFVLAVAGRNPSRG